MGSRVWTFRFLTSSSFPASKLRSKRRKYSLQSAPPLTKRSAWHNATSVVGWLWMQVQQNPPMPVCWSDSLTLNWWILTVAMAQTPLACNTHVQGKHCSPHRAEVTLNYLPKSKSGQGFWQSYEQSPQTLQFPGKIPWIQGSQQYPQLNATGNNIQNCPMSMCH